MEKTPEHLKANGWRTRDYAGGTVTLWLHPTKNWAVDFTTACELQWGIEMKAERDHGQD